MRQWILRSLWAAVLVGGCGPAAFVDTSYRNDAVALFQVGRTADAKAAFRAAVRRDPADPFALYYLGRIACLERNWEDAMDYLQCCLDIDPSYADARVWLALAEKRAGTVGRDLRFIPYWPARPEPPRRQGS